MFQYLYDGEYHTKTTVSYLRALGMDDEQVESIQGQRDFELGQEKDKVRAARDVKLAAIVGRVDRYNYQLATPLTSITDTEETYLALLQTAQELRDIPQQKGFPYTVVWPLFNE